jgi:hypothetical protein
VVTTRQTGEKFDWSKTWIAEMLLSQDEQKRRKQERESRLSVEEKRYNEMKAGVITSCVGLGVMIFLYVFMQGIIATGIPQDAAEILRRVWVVGVIPFFIGLGLLFNGLVVSKRLVEIARREFQAKETARSLASTGSKEDRSLAAAGWDASDSPRPSVTENTTRQLRDSD